MLTTSYKEVQNMHMSRANGNLSPAICIQFMAEEFHARSQEEISELSVEEQLLYHKSGVHSKTIEADMGMLFSFGPTEAKSILEIPIPKLQTIFLFITSGIVELEYDEESIRLEQNQGVTLCPMTDHFKIDWHNTNGTEFMWVSLPLKKLHTLFDTEVNSQNKSMGDHLVVKHFEIAPAIGSCLHQIRNYSPTTNSAGLYFKGKILEAIALSMQEMERISQAETACPVISGHEEWQRVHKAKDLLQELWEEPPSASELAIKVGLNEYKLKAGFKYMYGTTLFSFLKEYKLEKAKEWLLSENARVNEVAARIGYSNISHFIAAFKTKFGITPKQFLLSKQRSSS